MAAPPLRPSIGFCLQTESMGKAGRWYVNITKHKLVEMPVAYSGKSADKEWILKYGIGNLRVPFDMGSFRKLKERSDGARQTTFCIDVVFNPLIVQLFTDDDFCGKMEQYRPWLVNLAFNRIEESIGVKLSTQKVKLVKSVRYKDSEDASGIEAREFTDLPGGKGDYEFEDEDVSTAKVQSAPATSGGDDGPLIEDITPASQRKPAMKKGFLNSKDAAGSIYGEGGSKEGVVPENAGDPMGWMPKKLRQNSKIVDCNSPEYKAQEAQRKAAEETNSMNKEFRDTLMSSFDSMQAKQDKWGSDLPDGTDDQNSSKKYDVDYSRFNRIQDEADESTLDDRDWYYDSSGQRRQIDRRQPAASGSQMTGSGPAAEAGPAIKKGFFDNAKGSMYGPEGSTQAKDALSEAEMMKGFAELMGQDKSLMEGDTQAKGEELLKHFGELMGESGPGSAPAGYPAQASPKINAKTPELKTPDFKLNDVADGLQLVVSVPDLRSMEGVNLDVTERKASIAFPSGLGLRPLQIELPSAVVPTGVKAKFSKKSRELTVTLPKAN